MQSKGLLHFTPVTSEIAAYLRSAFWYSLRQQKAPAKKVFRLNYRLISFKSIAAFRNVNGITYQHSMVFG